MSRFYFHVREGDQLLRDRKGTELEDEAAVRFEARFVARNLARRLLLVSNQ